jgi:hypothetical protein
MTRLAQRGFFISSLNLQSHREYAGMKRLIVGLFCALSSCVALAAGSSAVRDRSESAMLITGTIEVAPDGSVSDYAIDHFEQVPQAVMALILKAAPTWKFQPLRPADSAGAVKANMSLRILAKWSDDKNYSISIAGANFSRDDETATGKAISYKTRKTPLYPYVAMRMGVSGTVYLLLRVDREGKVADVAVEQVNLDVATNDADMKKWRDELAYSAAESAKLWTFNVPTSGKHVNDPYWFARVPMVFSLRKEKYAQWKGYVPGPIQSVPWKAKTRLPSESVDAIPAGNIYSEGDGLHLITPLGGV